jgi:DNA ligase-1
MLAGVATVPFDSDDWLFEVKWDGYRCLAYLSDHGLYLDSRNGHPLLPQFPGLSALQSALEAKTALLDGEIVALKDGRVDFSRLRSGAESVVFIAFDILYLDGQLLLEAPLVRRRETLKGVMAWGGVAVLSEAIDGEGKALFSWARERDIEGVMAKRKGGLYYPGERRDEWLKIKNVREGVFWVVGYGPAPGRRLGSLLIAEKRGDG